MEYTFKVKDHRDADTARDRNTYRLESAFLILVEDTGRTHNINMHTFDTIAHNVEEAVGKMVIQRPEFRNRDILSVTIS